MNSNRARERNNPNPKLYANFFCRFTFRWLYPLFEHGRRNVLRPNDLYDVLPAYESRLLGDRFDSLWRAEVDESRKDGSKRPRLRGAIFKYLGCGHLFYGVLLLASALLRVSQPLLLAALIAALQDNVHKVQVYLRATYLLALIILDVLLTQHAQHALNVVGMRLRVACSSVIYRKLPKLSATCVERISKESVLKLLTRDVYKLDDLLLSLYHACVLPIQALLVAYVLSERVVGRLPTLAGHGFMLASTLPVQYLLGLPISQLLSKAATLRNKRTLILNELIAGIRTIKLYVWEKAFERIAVSTRRKEISTIKRYSYVRSSLLANLTFTNLVGLLLTIVAVKLQAGERLGTTEVYATALAYCYAQAQLVLRSPDLVRRLSEVRRAVGRIEKFLLLDEFERLEDSTSDEEVSLDQGRVIIGNASAKWSDRSISNTLLDVHLNLLPGKRYAVMGPSGAGKSSLLQLILGELKPHSGRIVVNGSASYAGQEPWLLAGTIRDNILFGEPRDDERYKEVLRLCRLEEDLRLLRSGDGSSVEECRSNDEVCAKVNLARAVYKEADIYLLDDPLHPSDAELGKRIIEECFEGLLKDKTCVLVTKRIQQAEKTDEIVFIRNGQIELRGTYSEFRKNDRLFYFLSTLGESGSDDRVSLANGDSRVAPRSMSEDDVPNDGPRSETERFIGTSKARKRSMYSRYFFKGNACVLTASVVSFVVAQALASGSFYWIAHWLNEEQLPLKRNDDSYQLELWILGGTTFGSVLASLIGSALLTKLCLDASEAIHNDMIARLLKTSIRFFESNSDERILDRFTKDVRSIDEDLPQMVLQMVQWFFVALGSLTLVLVAHWSALIFTPVVLYLFYTVRKRYLDTARCINRLEVEAKTPIISLANCALSGLPTIRAQQACSKLNETFDTLQNDLTSANFLSISSSMAYSFYLDVVSLLFVTLVTYVALSTVVDANYTALAILQSIAFTAAVQIFAKNHANAAMIKDKVDRVFVFTELENESEVDERMPMSWPKYGGIRFERVSTRSGGLRDVTLRVEPGTKVGIIGRDSAGKSSLISALLGLERIEGSIFIDDVDTAKVNVQQLREKISIVSQKQTIFRTSIRKNLDAVDRHDDSALWSALEVVGLKPVINSLDTSCEYLNAHQQRLLGLARAVIEDNRILILDDDSSLDSLVQSIVGGGFNSSTVIKMVNCVENVRDYDVIVVMDKGRVLQYGRSSAQFAQESGTSLLAAAECCKQAKVDDGDGLDEGARRGG